MQLKEFHNVRGALVLATCTALHGQAAQAESGQWKVDSAVLFYSEQDRVNVFEPAVAVSYPLTEDSRLTVRGVYDTLSGATPNGAVPSDKAETITGASGGSYSFAANTTPMKSFSDQRVALGLDWETTAQLARRTLSANFSVEHDYTSLGGSYTYSRDSEDRMTTLVLGAGVSFDLVSPSGSAPPAMTRVSTLPTGGGGGGGGEDEEGEGGGEGDLFSGESKFTADLLLGVTRILNRRSLLQLNYTHSQLSGYLNDPYKLLSTVNGNGQTMDFVFEKRPDSRSGNAVFLKYVYHLPQDVVHLSYRYYWDDWGVGSHTVDLRYRMELPGNFYLQPHLRYYTQTAADFYRPYLADAQALPAHASADYRLAEMVGTLAGIKLGKVLKSGGEFSLRLEAMQQTGTSHPAGAPGILRQYDLYPSLKATILQVGYSAFF